MKKVLLRNLITAVLLFLLQSNFAQIPLGTAARFVLFSSNGAVTNGGALSQLTGNVGTNNGASTGFGNVNGVMHDQDLASALCALEVQIAYTFLNIAIPTNFPAPLLGNGDTLTAGVHQIDGVTTLSGDLYLDAQGNPNAVFIFQIEAAFSTTQAAKIKLINGAQSCNVFWKVEGLVSMASETFMRGTVIAHNAAINMNVNDTLEGRALSTTGAISVDGILAYTPPGCNAPFLTGPAAPVLASAGCYALFSGNGAVTNAGVTNVTGDIGTNVGLTTGFDPLNVNGTIHPIPDGSTVACAADLLNAYNYLNALPYDIELLYPAQFGRNLVLTPHTYLMNAATSFTDTLYLNAQGNPDAVFVIKINGALTTSTYSKVILINGTQAKNVYWDVNGAVSINDYSIFNGTIICNNGAISLTTGVILNGRALTTDGAFSTAAVTVNGPLGDCITLPLNWLSFTAEKKSNTSVQLKWSTSNEINNDHFEVQRGNDGIKFVNLGSVPSVHNVNTAFNYAYTDEKAMYGNNYYRVKQVDHDGIFKYSEIRRITNTNDLWSVFPNPATTKISVRAQTQLKNISLTLIDNIGKSVYHQSYTGTNAGELLNIPLAGFIKGVYLLKIESDKGNKTEKIVVQ